MWMRMLAVGMLVAVGGACAGDDDDSSPSAATSPTPTTADAAATSQPAATTSASSDEGDPGGSSGSLDDTVAPQTTEPVATEPVTAEPTTSGPPPTACADLPVGVTDATLDAGGADHAAATSQPAATTSASSDEGDPGGSSGSLDDTVAPQTTEPVAPEPVTATSGPPPTACADLPVGVTDATLDAGGADHAVRYFVPSTYAHEPLPAVLNWHGLGSTGPEQAAYTGYEALAESQGFIVVHPTGVPAPGVGQNSWDLADGQIPGRDDLAFANTLIDTLIADWCVDPSRIYSTGMSNGGFFTSRMVCEAADRIAAASSVAGTFHPDGCAPARPVPYLAFHGTADVVVPFAGGGQSVLLTNDDPIARAFFEQVMPDEFAQFAADDGCSPDPTATAVGDEVIRYDYAGCAEGTPMAFFEVTGGGHTWPGSPLGDQLAGVLGHTTDDVDATADSWAFFQQHTLDG